MASFPLSEHEFTLDGGATTALVTGTNAVVPVGAVDKANGQVGVRVRANGLRPASAWLFNSVPFTANGNAWNGKPINVLCLGDSITFGFKSSYPYPAQLQDAFGVTNYQVRNRGITGNDTGQMLARVATDVDASYDAVNFSHNVCIILGGINDNLHNSYSLDQTKANLLKLWKDRIAIGFKTIACTLTYTKYLETYVDQLNAWIRANWQAAGCAGLCELNQEPALLYPTDTDFFDSDGLHPVALGDTHIARPVKAAIDAVLTPFGVPAVAYTWSIDTDDTGTLPGFSPATGTDIAWRDFTAGASQSNTTLMLAGSGDMATSSLAMAPAALGTRGFLELIPQGSSFAGLLPQPAGDPYTYPFCFYMPAGGGGQPYGSIPGDKLPSTPFSGTDMLRIQVDEVATVVMGAPKTKAWASYYKNGTLFSRFFIPVYTDNLYAQVSTFNARQFTGAKFYAANPVLR